MKLSNKQKQKLFECISGEVTDLKIDLCKDGGIIYHPNPEIDKKISRLDIGIWKRIKKEMEIK